MPYLSKEERFAQRILLWFSGNERIFPWRETTDPYRILVVENLLRKTTAKQVRSLYETFFLAFPNPQELASAHMAEIANIIKPLGLQNQRSLSLYTIAKKVVEIGRVPNKEEELLSLPGVGQYIADAVRCLAYGEVTPMVDRNVVRVIDRVFSVLPSRMNPLSEVAAKAVREFIKGFLPRNRSRSFNLALLDFAAGVCRAKNPLCSNCPQKDICDWHSSRK